MADDRYTWLDEETAERLLRGLPVDAREARTPNPEEQNPPQRDIQRGNPELNAAKSDRRRKDGGALNVPSDAWFQDADRRAAALLASALDELATEHSTPPQAARDATPVELPGEAEALHAFREAYFGVLRSGSVGAVEPGGDSASGSASESATSANSPSGSRRRGRAGGRAGRSGSGGSRSARSLLVGRPLRAGFAMALAGCALGGVAVAAGTGVLPTPFGGGGSPAVSVSPVASPSDGESDGGRGGGEGTDRGRDTTGEKHDGKHRSKDPDDKDGGGRDENDIADSGAESGSPHERGKGERHGGGRDQDDDRDERHGPGYGGGGDKKAIAAALCRAYSDGRLNANDRRKLERAAGGRTVVQKFCARYGLPPAASGGASNGAVGSGGSGHGNGGEGGSGGDEEPGESGGSGGEDDSGGAGGADGGTSGGTPTVPGGSGATGASSGASGAAGTTGTSGASGSTDSADGAVTGATSGK